MSESIRNKYDIPSGSKLLLYVGNVSRNKNQMQLVEAFSLLQQPLRDTTFVLFCGKVNTRDCDLRATIGSSPHKDHFRLCGSIDKEDMANYYKEADGVVLLSVAEGFGLSLIEGMAFGLPCATFCDLDAYSDIYNQCAVVGILSRDNQSVADGIAQLLTREWDGDAIRRHSRRFDNHAMARNYVSVYNSIMG